MGKVRTEDALRDIVQAIVGNVSAIPVQEVTVPRYPVGKGDPEEMVMLISDMQVGHMTPTTNAEVVAQRLDKYVKSALKILRLNRRAHPVDKLHIMLLGDIVHNESVGRTVSLDELEMVLSKQMFEVAVPVLENAILTLRPHFLEGVDIWAVNGNHGKMSKFNAENTNMDGIVYRFLEARLSGYKDVRFHLAHNSFYQHIEIMNHGFLVMHGDQIRMQLTLPYYGVTTRAMRLQGSVGKFEYLILGHFHVPAMLHWIDTEIFMNGCFVSDDQWGLKVLGMSGVPKQLMFFVHGKQGVSARYVITL